MLLRVALCLALVAAAAYGLWEARRWSLPALQDLLSPKQRVLRAWSLFFLLASLGLCLGWTYLPKPHTRRELINYTQYVMLICLTVLPIIPLAFLDSRENLRHLAEARRKIFQETIGPLSEKTVAEKTADPPPSTPA